MGSLLISLLASLLISHVNLLSSPEPTKEITIGVAVDDNNQVAANAIRAALGTAKLPDVDVRIKEVVLMDEKTEDDVCTALISLGPPVDLMIDATILPSASGRRTSAVVKNFARGYGMPTISTTYSLGYVDPEWKDISESEREWLLHIQPPGDIIPAVVKSVAVEYSMNTAGIFYDSTFEMEHQFTSILEPTSVRYIIRKIPDDSIRGFLAEIRGAQLLNYFVLGSMPTINKIFEAAAADKMFGTEYAWFMVTKSRGKIKCKECHDARVTLIQPKKAPATDYNQSLAQINSTLETKVDAYFFYDLVGAALTTIVDLKKKNKWPQLEYPKCGSHLSVEQAEQRKDLNLGRELSLDGHYGRFGRYLFDDYKYGTVYQDLTMKLVRVDMYDDRPYVYHTFGEWTYDEGGGRIMYPAYFDEKKYGKIAEKDVLGDTPVGKRVLQIVIITQPPFIMKRYNSSAPKGFEYYGYCIDLLNMIQAKMANNTGDAKWEWDYELEEVRDGRFGEKVNGSWTGIIGMLAQKRADVGLGPIAVMAERETVVDFTVPYYDLVGINILMKKPAVPSHLFKFLTVLDNRVWLSVLLSYLLTATMIWIYDRVSPYSYYNNKEGWGDQKRRDFSLKEALWFCMTSLTPQGGGEAPQNLSGRLIAGTWWTFGFIVIAAYTANLAAFLTVSRLDSTIESLDHLSDQFRIRYAPQAATQSEVYFQRMSYIEHKFYEIWKNMSLNPLTPVEERAKYAVWDYPISDKYTKMLGQMYQAGMPNRYEEGVARTRNSRSAQEGFAFIADATLVKYAILNHCDLHSIGNEFSRKPIALVVQQNSTLKDKLSSAILKLLNERKLETLKEKWWSKYRRVCEDTKKSNDGISIHNIGGVFIVIFAGVVLACITLLFEYCMLRRKRKPRVPVGYGKAPLNNLSRN